MARHSSLSLFHHNQKVAPAVLRSSRRNTYTQRTRYLAHPVLKRKAHTVFLREGEGEHHDVVIAFVAVVPVVVVVGVITAILSVVTQGQGPGMCGWLLWRGNPTVGEGKKKDVSTCK